MSDNKNYTELPLEELLTAKKKIKKQGTISAFLIGLCIGVIVYGVAKNGFGFLYIFIPLFLISGIYKHSLTSKQKLEEIQAAINAKKT